MDGGDDDYSLTGDDEDGEAWTGGLMIEHHYFLRLLSGSSR